MNKLHSSVFGTEKGTKTVFNQTTLHDIIIVELDENKRLVDVRFANPNRHIVKSCETHTIVSHEQPFCGFSVEIEYEKEWMMWERAFLKNFTIFSEYDGSECVWFGKEYKINEITLFKTNGTINGLKLSAILSSSMEPLLSDDEHEEKCDNNNQTVDQQLENSERENVTEDPFFFTDHHIWYIQISLLILAALIILGTLIFG